MRLSIILALLLAAPAVAADVFVAPVSAGGNTGADCADARAVSSLAAGDWVAANIIHLCSGTYSFAITAQGSGSAGNPVTLRFETGATMSFAAVPSSGAIIANTKSYITIDGNSSVTCGYVEQGASPPFTRQNVACNNGAILSTANGSGLANQVSSVAIELQGSDHIIVKNLLCGPLYTHTSFSDASQSPPGPICVHYNNTHDITIQNNTMHDCAWCMNGGAPVGGGGGANYTINNNEVYNYDHGVGMGNVPSMTNIVIHDNHFHDSVAWDQAGSAFHHDGINLFGDDGPIITVSEYANMFDGDPGVSVTAYIYNEGNIQNALMYRNVGIVPATRESCCGWFDFYGNGTSGSTTNASYNNTLVGAYKASPNTTNGCFALNQQAAAIAKNNVWLECNNLISVPSANSPTVNNNVYEDICTDHSISPCSSSNAFNWNSSYSSGVFSGWQTACSCDASSEFAALAALNVNTTTGQPNVGSPILTTGANLTSLSIATLDADFFGVVAPASGVWAAGAFQQAATVPLFAVAPAMMALNEESQK